MRYLFLFIALGVSAADWPTYRADSARSGVTKEQLKLPLQPAWTHQPQHAPRPAWRNPARRDMYNDKNNDLKHRQLFDHAFHVVADAKQIYFGSSADDQVHCLDATTGKERWSYFTEGPVRLAPTLHRGKLYFGSDDGHAYCITTEGKAVWRQRLAPKDYRIAGNNRIISAWPVRTGILVDNGMAYASAGMFPSEKVHLVGFSAVDGKEKWRTTSDKLPAQGYLLMSKTLVYVPTGRSAPILIRRVDGHPLGVSAGQGGTEATMMDGGFLFSGPGRTGNMVLVKGREDGIEEETIATFPGNQFVVGETHTFLLGEKQLTAIDRRLFSQNANEAVKGILVKRKLAAELGALRKKVKAPGISEGRRELLLAQTSGVQRELALASRRKDLVVRAMNTDLSQVAPEVKKLLAQFPAVQAQAKVVGVELQDELKAAAQALQLAVEKGKPGGKAELVQSISSARKELKAAWQRVDEQVGYSAAEDALVVALNVLDETETAKELAIKAYRAEKELADKADQVAKDLAKKAGQAMEAAMEADTDEAKLAAAKAAQAAEELAQAAAKAKQAAAKAKQAADKATQAAADPLQKKREADAKVKKISKDIDKITKARDDADELAQLSTVANVLWRVDCNQPNALILTRDAIFAGGTDEVVSYNVADGKQAWSAKVNGTAYGLAVAHGRLLVSTHKGTIHCFITK